jgi:hypothetical protein
MSRLDLTGLINTASIGGMGFEAGLGIYNASKAADPPHQAAGARAVAESAGQRDSQVVHTALSRGPQAGRPAVDPASTAKSAPVTNLLSSEARNNAQ